MAKRKYLKKEEMISLDLLNEKVKSKKYEVEIMQYRAREVQLKINSLATELQDEKDKLKNFTDIIKKDFKHSGTNFGYDPITGEVSCE